jgi:hypothetical protein
MQSLGLGSQSDGEEGDGTIVDLSSSIDEMLLNNLVQQFDYFSDNPWPLLYERLDRAYPDSLFILTRRKVDSWINSLLKYSSDQNTRMRQMVYGYGNPHRHVSRYRKVYLSHNRAVEEYFADRKDFLLVDLEENDAIIAQRLQEFLGIDSGVQSFPLLNKGEGR